MLTALLLISCIHTILLGAVLIRLRHLQAHLSVVGYRIHDIADKVHQP
jgi:hypothetical protein